MPSIFQGTRNIHGDLPPEARRRVMAFIEAPSFDSWQAASSILVRPLTTLWQAVRMVDPTFPKEGRQVVGGKVLKEWARVPDSITVVRAIRHVVEKAEKKPKKRPDLFDFEEYPGEVKTADVHELFDALQAEVEDELDRLVDP